MELDPRPTRLLFVDDETAVLDGIRNALRRDRKRWDMTFAAGPEAALAHLETEQFDVVVSDMRMPGMDGAALLEKVRELQPLALRFVLSGHADRAAVTRAQSVAHHFLSKPCEPVVLRGMLERATDLSRRIRSEPLGRLIASLPALPPTPEPIWPTKSAEIDPLRSPVAGVLSREPLTSDRFLRMVNTIFGMKSSHSETDGALVQLGGDVAGAMVLGAQAFEGFQTLGVSEARVESLQNHSLLTAWLASSMLDDRDEARTAFTAGLLHDMGRLVLELAYQAAGDPGDGPRGDDDDEEEEDRFGVTHVELGAYLLARWGLPLPIIEAVVYHHQPPPVAGSFSVPWAVHLADALVHEAEGGGGDEALSGLLQTQRTTVAFMTDLEHRMTEARRQLMGHTEGQTPSYGR